MARVPQPKRGEIWLVRFDPSIGAEIRLKTPKENFGTFSKPCFQNHFRSANSHKKRYGARSKPENSVY